MKKISIPAALAILATILVPSVSNAMGSINADDHFQPRNNEHDHFLRGAPHVASAVPELSTGTATGALVILAGAALIASGRRRRAQSQLISNKPQ